MKEKPTNDDVFDFLAEECQKIPELWEKFAFGILSQTTDASFWETLSEFLDCFRICEECGKPMIEGFVINGHNTYCSNNCLHKHFTNDEYVYLYNNGNSDTYWTVWYENSISFKPREEEGDNVIS